MKDQEKYKALLERREKLLARLKDKHKGYRGVIHEDSLSELRHGEVKALEAQLILLQEEIDRYEGA